MLRPYRHALSAPARPSRLGAQTTFRAMLTAPQVDTLVASSSRRQRALLMRIEHTLAVEELLDLAPQAVGPAELAWHRRLRDLTDAAPLVARRLSASESVLAASNRGLVQEHLIAALFRYGAAGATHLLACFDHLGPYAQSQACVALGLLHHRPAANQIWDCHCRLADNPRYCLGPLWGLMDLPDPRATLALTTLLLQKRAFAELYGMLARKGGAACVVPLLYRIARLPKARRRDPLLALAAIAQRIGREALLAEFARVSTHPDEATTMRLLTLPAPTIMAHFAWYDWEIALGPASLPTSPGSS
jgi:hypothetical protein